MFTEIWNSWVSICGGNLDVAFTIPYFAALWLGAGLKNEWDHHKFVKRIRARQQAQRVAQ